MRKIIVVVGAGFCGIRAAKAVLDAGHDVLILEKKSTLGGAWREFANTTSRVQVISPIYQFDLPGQESHKTLTDFTPKEEILTNAEQFFKTHQLDQHTIFNAEVTAVREFSRTKVRIDYLIHDQPHQIVVDGALLFLGCLTKPNAYSFPQEALFRGRIALGLHDDIAPEEFKDREVLILGAGAFAVENARTALEFGAKRVRLLSNSCNLILPQYAHYYLESHLDVDLKTATYLVKQPAKTIGQSGWLSKIVHPSALVQKTITPISDLFYIGAHAGKIEMIRGHAACFYHDGVVTKSQKKIRADLVLKCLGFSPAPLDHITELDYLEGFSVNGNPRIQYFTEGNGGIFKNLSPSSLSAFLISDMGVDGFLYFLRYPDQYQKIKKHLPLVYFQNWTVSHVEDSLKAYYQNNRDLKYHISYRKAEVRRKIFERYPEKEFRAQNKKKWEEAAKKWGSSAPYPYNDYKGTSRVGQKKEALLARLITAKYKKISIYNQKASQIPSPPYRFKRMVNETRIPVRGASLYVNERGRGTPIVCIHGMPQTSWGWAQTADLLSEDYRVITYDLRGLGKSSYSAGGYDLKTQSEDLKRILDFFQVESAIILGMDIGGCIAQQFALDYPKQTQSLICISTLPLENAYHFVSQPKQWKTSWYTLFFQIPRAEYAVHYLRKPLLKRGIRFSQNLSLEASYQEEYTQSLKTVENCRAFLNYYRAWKTNQKVILEEQNKRFSMPTLWMKGSEDLYVPHLDQYPLSRFDQIEKITLKGHSHWLPEENSDLLIKHLSAFLTLEKIANEI